MIDLIPVLKACMGFMPTKEMPGLNCCLIDFYEGDKCHIYATNGFMMARFAMEDAGQAPPDGGVYIGHDDIGKIVSGFRDNDDVAVSVFGDDVLVTSLSGSLVSVKRFADGDFTVFKKFFDYSPISDRVVLSHSLISHAITKCQQFCNVFGSSGTAYSVRVQQAGKGKLAVVSPKVVPNLPNLAAIDIAIMGMNV